MWVVLVNFVFPVLAVLYVLWSFWISGVIFSAVMDEKAYDAKYTFWHKMWLAVGMVVFWPFLLHGMTETWASSVSAKMMLALFDVGDS